MQPFAVRPGVEEGLIVAKFGGSSLADAETINNAIAIVRADPRRTCVVVSAPGKRNSKDEKVTDLLYRLVTRRDGGFSFDGMSNTIKARYRAIVDGLGIVFDLDREFDRIITRIKQDASADYVASRGEYLMGKIMAIALGYEFVDPADCISLDDRGRNLENDEYFRTLVAGRRVVIPGFYGSTRDGEIKTFSRGGSDITGAIVARALRAVLYENWTDVPGLLMADPRIVKNPLEVAVATYSEVRELAYMGAEVFHPAAMFAARDAGIPINIRSTRLLEHFGTLIVPEQDRVVRPGEIVGVAGRRGFTVLKIEEAMMNDEVGFVDRVLAVLRENGISYEHMPSGIDVVSIIVDDRQIHGKLEYVLERIQEECSPDTLEVCPPIAMISTVGKGMIHTPGVAARLFQALADAGINVRMINQGSSELSIITGVQNEDLEPAIRAIYNAFAG